MLLNLNQWFGLNTRWPFSNYVSRMPGLDKYLVSSQKWEHYKLYLVPYCCFNSISVFHQQGSSHSLGYEIYQLYHEKSQYFNWLKLLQFFCFMICPGDGQSSSSRKWSEHHVSGHCPTSQRKTTSLVSADLHWHWHLSHCWQLLPQPQWCPHNVTPLCFSILESC